MADGRLIGYLQSSVFRRVCISVACSLIAFGCSRAATERPAPPNRIIVIVVDTLRADYLGAAGGPVPTPNMDRLVAEGATAANASGSFHQTTMSMGAFFTGATPSLESGDRNKPLEWNGKTWCGVARFGTGEAGSECLPFSRQTIAEKLRDAGYTTVGVMSNQLLFKPAGFDRGFDVWREVGKAAPRDPSVDMATWSERARDARNAQAVTAAVYDALDEREAERLFLYVHFMDVHDWFILGDPARSTRHTNLYGEAVTGFDRALGGFLDELRSRGLTEDAAIVLLADHGEGLNEPHPITPMPTHLGNPSYQTVLRVPFVVWPAKYGKSLHDPDRIWRSEDVHRWVSEIAGTNGSPPGSLRENEVFVTERLFQTFVSGSWKYVRTRKPARTLLFDLERDPSETVDVSAEHPDKVAAFDRRVDELTRSLAASTASEFGLSDRDANRLRALGYLE